MKKFSLNSQLQPYQILTNDDQMLIFCLSYFITTVSGRCSLLRGRDLAPIFEDSSQSRNLSEIKPPLKENVKENFWRASNLELPEISV